MQSKVRVNERADGAPGVQDFGSVRDLRSQAMPVGIRDNLTMPAGFTVA